MLITTQTQYQNFPKPPFCYLCGKPLDGSMKENRDHCPPEKIFAVRDRSNYPTLVRVHENCNNKWSILDNKYAAMWSVLSKNPKNVEAEKTLIKSLNGKPENGPRLTYNVPFDKLYYRIVRFAHALFYQEFLPELSPVTVFSPMMELDKKTLAIRDQQLELHRKFCEVLCYAQSVERFDGIKSFNGKFKYVCAWDAADNGEPVCLFAFDIYNSNFFNPFPGGGFPRCFVGHYQFPRPDNAQVCGKGMIHVPSAYTLYPIKI